MTLATSQVAAFSSRGWLIVRNMLPDDTIAMLRSGVDDLTDWSTDADAPGLHHFEQTDTGPAIARSEYFVDDHPTLGSFIRSGVVVEALAQLFGDDAVLFKEKVNYKHPGGGGFAPHQDATAYRFVDHHISVMVPIDSATEASGCLYFADGHEVGRLPTDHRGRVREDVANDLDWVAAPVEPGDVVFFDSYAPHHSDSNLTDKPRRALYLTYNAAAKGDYRATYYEDKLAEFDAAGDEFADGEERRVRISINDDFLGKPVEAPS